MDNIFSVKYLVALNQIRGHHQVGDNEEVFEEAIVLVRA